MKSAFPHWLLFGGVFVMSGINFLDDVSRLVVIWPQIIQARVDHVPFLSCTQQNVIGGLLAADVFMLVSMLTAGLCLIMNDLRINDRCK